MASRTRFVCPWCAGGVKARQFRRHVRRVHGVECSLKASREMLAAARLLLERT